MAGSQQLSFWIYSEDILKGKEDITGIEYEPWHFRYVGKTAAPVIMEQGITLEEFWEEYVEDVSID